MKRNYTICGKGISIESELPITEHENFNIFAVSEGDSDIKITYHVADKLPSMPVNLKETPVGAMVSWEGENIFRHTPMGVAEGALSCYKITDTSQSEVHFTNRSYGVMSDFRYMWNSVSLGQLFLPFKILLFHASYILLNGEAILFTAQCGVGKSTQAELWRKYMGAEVINGDKAGVSVDHKGVYAHGLPFCGTSGICKNKSAPLKAIVLLSQAPENKINRVTGVQAIQSLMGNIYLDFVAPGETQQCVDTLIELLSTVPVYHLQCTPDEKAVKCLAEELIMIDYDFFINHLFAKGTERGTPISGTFELTPRCTLNCKMCYIHRSPNSCEAIEREKSTEWWLNLAREARKEGMLLLLLTGGEPLLRSDFEEIYLECRKMGFLVSVNTNGTLIDDKKVKFFAENPPQRLNITLYGTSEETYGNLCGDRTAFKKVIYAIKALKEAGVNIKLNYSINPYNKDDMLKAYDIAKALDLHIQPVSYMFPPLRASCEGEAVRLTAESAAKAQFDWQYHHLGDADFKKYLHHIKMGESPEEFGEICVDKTGEKINCRAGSTVFWVTWDGKMTPCGMMVTPAAEINDFKSAWQYVRAEREKVILPAQCKSCSLRKTCDVCAAVTFAETGKYDGVPTYVCEKAKAYNRLCKEFLGEK